MESGLMYNCQIDQFFPLFSGVFTKLRKATVSFVMSVRLSVHLSAWNNSALTGRIFMKFIWVFFENLSRMFNFH